MMPRISLTSSLRDAVDGAESIELHAETIGEMFAKLAERYPRMADRIDAGIAVAIDGHIYRDDWNAKIPADAAEVFLLPRIQGG